MMEVMNIDKGFYWCKCKQCGYRTLILLENFDCSNEESRCRNCGLEDAFGVLRMATKQEVQKWSRESIPVEKLDYYAELAEEKLNNLKRLVHIKYSDFTKDEKRFANIIINSSETIFRLGLDEFSEIMKIDKQAINDLCLKIGYKNYEELRKIMI